MGHCAVVTPIVVQPQLLIPLVAVAAVGAVGATVIEGQRRAQASHAFRSNLLDALEDLNEQGISVEEADLEADTIFTLDCEDGTTITVKKMPDGQYQLIGPGGGALLESVMQQYTYEAAKADFTAEGFNVVAEDVDEQGNIKLLASRWGAQQEQVEALIPQHGPMQYQGFGMPPQKCGDTIERLAVRIGQVVERRYHTEEVLQTVRLFPTTA